MDTRNIPVKILDVDQNRVNFMVMPYKDEVELKKQDFMKRINWGLYDVINPESLSLTE